MAPGRLGAMAPPDLSLFCLLRVRTMSTCVFSFWRGDPKPKALNPKLYDGSVWEFRVWGFGEVLGLGSIVLSLAFGLFVQFRAGGQGDKIGA